MNSEKIGYRILLFAVIFLHLYIVFANAAAFLLLPFLVRWYIAAPLCSFIFYVSFVRGVKCPLTEVENKLRIYSGLKELDKSFIVYYIIRPLKKLARKIKGIISYDKKD